MGENPTFHLQDDYVAMMELKPAERTVYSLLRCNAAFGRHGVAEHAVHVTASWFTEMTAHWENPLPASTARRGLNGLIAKGVLIRLNEPQDGSGFVVAFVADPRGRVEGPVNGFEHAKKVKRRCGTKAYYERKDEIPGIPAVTGVRLGTKRFPAQPPKPKPSDWDAEQAALAAKMKAAELEELTEPEPEPDMDYEPDFEEMATGPETTGRAPQESTPLGELTELLVTKCHGKGQGRRGLLYGEARRVAEACFPALKEGWTPEGIANKLSALVTDGIHSTEMFLRKKAADLGAPPAAVREDGTVKVNGQYVDLGSVSVWGSEEDERDGENKGELVPAQGGSADKRAHLAELARKARRQY